MVRTPPRARPRRAARPRRLVAALAVLGLTGTLAACGATVTAAARRAY
ncbi:hypothetical protein NKH77_41045 [Streptomyces sp. M19]